VVDEFRIVRGHRVIGISHNHNTITITIIIVDFNNEPTTKD